LQKLIGKSESRHHSGDKDETDRIAILIGLRAGHASNGNRNISGRAGWAGRIRDQARGEASVGLVETDRFGWPASCSRCSNICSASDFSVSMSRSPSSTSCQDHARQSIT
jgi:hypothetical protein